MGRAHRTVCTAFLQLLFLMTKTSSGSAAPAAAPATSPLPSLASGALPGTFDIDGFLKERTLFLKGLETGNAGAASQIFEAYITPASSAGKHAE